MTHIPLLDLNASHAQHRAWIDPGMGDFMGNTGFGGRR